MSEWWEYENLESGHPYDWSPAQRNDHPDDNIDFHLDLGAGNLPKARLSIDRHGDSDVLIDLNTLNLYKFGKDYSASWWDKRERGTLPFPDDSIHSIISHHCLEHIGDGFIRLMDECYRVLRPGAKFRIIVPMFPSFTAVDDPEHQRYFCENTFESFCHEAGPETPFWYESCAPAYTKCRFHMAHKEYTPPRTFRQIAADHNSDNIGTLTIDDLFKQGREIRVTLQKPE